MAKSLSGRVSGHRPSDDHPGASGAHGSGWLNDERVREGLFYLLVVALACAGAYWFLELWRTDLHVLMINSWDARAAGATVKGLLEHGSYFVNPDVGAPGVLNSADFPSVDALSMFILRFVGLVTGGDYAFTVNAFYLLTYPLTAVSAAFVLRRFGISRAAALVAAVLFAFLPYHYLRGTAHLFLSAYFLVPIAVLIALSMDMKAPPFFRLSESDGPQLSFAPVSRTSLAWGAAALALGLAGIYYAYFSCVLILLAGVYASVRGRTWKRLASAGTAVGFTVLAVVVQLIPSWVYTTQNGPNLLAAARNPRQADLYGLRISQLVLPLPIHRLAAVTGAFQSYWSDLAAQAPGVGTETFFAALGLVGALGFFVLLAWLAFVRFTPVRSDPVFARLMDGLAVLNLGGLLLATVGGFGAIIAIALPLIRCYNRMSVFLGFIALFAIALLLDRLHKWLSRVSAGAAVFVVVCVLVLTFGFLDQTSPTYLPDYASAAAHDQSDTTIVGQLQQSLPQEAMVFQLPFIAYPEGEPSNGMYDYQHFRGPLHSTSLRWSYGAMKGRPESEWSRSISALPTVRMVQEVQKQGFKAIWVDRTGYADRGATIISEIAAATKSQPLESPDGEVAVFVLP